MHLTVKVYVTGNTAVHDKIPSDVVPYDVPGNTAAWHDNHTWLTVTMLTVRVACHHASR